MPKPERYIVHIYRRQGSGKAMRVAGLLEKIGNGPQRRFSNGTQLWALLNESPRQSQKNGGRRSKSGREVSE